MARRKDTITLSDPRALRALAHPARQRLITELFAGRVLTATEAAALVELSPSAVSHHLRALEAWGLARRAAGSGDGRERPWEGTAKNITLKGSSDSASQAAMSSIVATQLDDLGRTIDAMRRRGDPPKEGYRGLSRGDLWLTEEEIKDLTETVEARIAEYRKGRSTSRHPRAARRVGYAWSLVPVETPSGATPTA